MRNGLLIIFIFLLLIFQQCTFLKFSSAIEKDSKFKSGDLTLSGTLLLPEGKGPFPAIIFVHGSGAETRDNSSYSANWLTEIGYAAFIYDKRGTGESEGKKESISYFSFEDLANDAVAAANMLSKNKKIDKTKIGIHASSQGGWVAPLAASKSDLINFMIIRSASAVTVSEDRIYERGERLKGEGFTLPEVAESRDMQLIEGKGDNEKSNKKFEQLYEKNLGKKWFGSVYGNDTKLDNLDEYREWYVTIADFNPIYYLRKLDIPVVWIFGDPAKDKLGPIENSIENVRKLMNEGKDHTVLQYDGEGHNINEAMYEKALFDWLRNVNQYSNYEFRTH